MVDCILQAHHCALLSHQPESSNCELTARTVPGRHALTTAATGHIHVDHMPALKPSRSASRSEEEGISSALKEAGLSDEAGSEEEAESAAWVKPLTAAQRRRYRDALAPGPAKEVGHPVDLMTIPSRPLEKRCNDLLSP